MRPETSGSESTHPQEPSEGKSSSKRTRSLRYPAPCTECKRLKLKCNRKSPCSTCVRRECSNICREGTPISGKGSRFILADTEKLHMKISVMSDRIRQLEDALASDHSAITPEPHPLLSKDLMRIKSTLDGSEVEQKDPMAAEGSAENLEADDQRETLRGVSRTSTGFPRSPIGIKGDSAAFLQRGMGTTSAAVNAWGQFRPSYYQTTGPFVPEEHSLLARGNNCLLAAKGAFEHLQSRRSNIIHALNSNSSIVAMAGFNEELVRQGSGFLQEIHLFFEADFSPEAFALEAVGKLCAPFPCMIFMPSGLTFRPSLYNLEGKSVTFEQAISSSACEIRYKDVVENAGMVVSPTDDDSGAPIHYVAGDFVLSSGGSEAPGSNPQISQSSADSRSSEQDYEMEVDESENRRPEAAELRQGATKQEGREPDLGKMPTAGSDPSGPEDGSITSRRPRIIHFDVLAAIHHPPPLTTLLQELQITGDFTLQASASLPGKHTIIQFQKLKCQSHRRQGRFKYSQFYLKVLIDTYEGRWLLSPNVSPKDTSASDGQERHTNATKGSLQQAVKVAMKFNPFGAGVSLEGSRTAETSTAAERLVNRSRIIQREKDGVFWWGYHVDDENAKEGGTDLNDSTLPFADMVYFRNRKLTNAAPAKPVRVEVSSFWSLVTTDAGAWFTTSSDDSPPPVYSNLCQLACMDLSPDLDDDAIYKAKINFGTPGLPSERVKVELQDGISGNPYVLPLGDADMGEAVGKRYLQSG